MERGKKEGAGGGERRKEDEKVERKIKKWRKVKKGGKVNL